MKCVAAVFSSIESLFHARDAATEKAPTPLTLRLVDVDGTTNGQSHPFADTHSEDRVGMLAAGVSRSAMYAGVWPRKDCEPEDKSL